MSEAERLRVGLPLALAQDEGLRNCTSEVEAPLLEML